MMMHVPMDWGYAQQVWYAVDAAGVVGQFTPTNHAAIPCAAIMGDDEASIVAEDLEMFLSEEEGEGRFWVPLCFRERPSSGASQIAEPYHRDDLDLEPDDRPPLLHLQQLPTHLQETIGRVKLTGVTFANAAVLQPAQHVACYLPPRGYRDDHDRIVPIGGAAQAGS